MRYFKSLLSHVEVIYYNWLGLSQSQVGYSQYEPVDDVWQREKLTENKKCRKEGLDEGLKTQNIDFDDFYKKLTSYIDSKFTQQKSYFEKKFDEHGVSIDGLRVDLIIISLRFS